MKFHFLLPFIVVILALAFLDPFQLLMPTMFAETILGLLVLATVFYGVAIFKENPNDEREEHIRSLGHRVSYMVAMIGLVLIIAYYLITKGHVYPETIILLVILVITKTVVHWYGHRNL